MKNILFISLIVVSLTAVSYAEQIPMPKPVTDCKATLEAWGNPPNCYCPCDTCRPVCTEPEKPKSEKDKQSMVNLYAESSSYEVNVSNSTATSNSNKSSSDEKNDDKSLKDKVKDAVEKAIDNLDQRNKPKCTNCIIGTRG